MGLGQVPMSCVFLLARAHDGDNRLEARCLSDKDAGGTERLHEARRGSRSQRGSETLFKNLLLRHRRTA